MTSAASSRGIEILLAQDEDELVIAVTLAEEYKMSNIYSTKNLSIALGCKHATELKVLVKKEQDKDVYILGGKDEEKTRGA